MELMGAINSRGMSKVKAKAQTKEIQTMEKLVLRDHENSDSTMITSVDSMKSWQFKTAL